MGRASWFGLRIFGGDSVVAAVRLTRTRAAPQLGPEQGGWNLTDKTYGFAAGVFFVAYTLLEVPSNILLSRFGGPAWLSRIMITWGTIAACGVALFNATGFYVLRVAMGLAEAGFYPGMAYYLSGWFLEDEFGECYAFVTLGSCSSGVLGGPLAIALMSMDGLGSLYGWQWLFLCEGLPAIALGCVYHRLLPTTPADAWFLSDRQRSWMVRRHAAAKRHKPKSGSAADSVKAAFTNWRVVYLGVVHLFGLAAYYGIIFWVPELVKSILYPHGHAPKRRKPDARVIGLSVIPYFFASVGLVVNAAHARKTKEQRWHAVIPMAFGAAGLMAVAPLKAHGMEWVALVALTVGNVGAWAEHGPMAALWDGAVAKESPETQAAAFALINSLGNVGGFMGSYAPSMLKKGEDDYSGATYFLGSVLAIACLMVVFYPMPTPTTLDAEASGLLDEAELAAAADDKGLAGERVSKHPHELTMRGDAE